MTAAERICNHGLESGPPPGMGGLPSGRSGPPLSRTMRGSSRQGYGCERPTRDGVLDLRPCLRRGGVVVLRLSCDVFVSARVSGILLPHLNLRALAGGKFKQVSSKPGSGSRRTARATLETKGQHSLHGISFPSAHLQHSKFVYLAGPYLSRDQDSFPPSQNPQNESSGHLSSQRDETSRSIKAALAVMERENAYTQQTARSPPVSRLNSHLIFPSVPNTLALYVSYS